MKTKKNKITKSTYDLFIEDPKRKKLLEKEYQKLTVSELLIEAMKDAQVSVRKLAEESGVSPTIIQELRTGKRTNITLTTFDRVLNAIGYEISIGPKR